MTAAAQIGAGRPLPPLTTPQRTALRLMRSGALIRAANGAWYSRAFPHQPVNDRTVQALAERGFASIASYRGLYDDERRCAVPTPLGEAFNAGRNYAPAPPPPPVAAEVVLREVETALAVLDAEAEKLRSEILQDSAAIRDGRQALARAEASLAAAEKRLEQREHARQSLNARRTELLALVAHTCERIGAVMLEAGR
ncbi:hypothetical protein GGC47_003148 [Bosea sp. OAE752]|uniref:hypothetical protein n=1 Tax=Bosea sp. OAE752 TaxID=2663873 RepID=UPI003D1D5F19